MNTNTAVGSDKLTIVIPAHLLAQIDAQVGSAFIDREEFIRAAVRQYLDYLREARDLGSIDAIS